MAWRGASAWHGEAREHGMARRESMAWRGASAWHGDARVHGMQASTCDAEVWVKACELLLQRARPLIEWPDKSRSQSLN